MVYLDTSALARRYLNEAGSDDFEAYLIARGSGQVSTLTVTEMRCLLARRCRAGDINEELEGQIFAAFEEDLIVGVLALYRLRDEDVWEAARLVSELCDHALRTLDALHPSCARAVGATGLVTADQQMAAAAEALGLEVVRF